MMKLASIYMNKKNDFETSAKLLQEILAKYPKGRFVQEMELSFISNCSRSKHYQEVLDECNKPLVNYPKEHPLAMHAIEAKGRMYVGLKEYDKAIEVYQTILKIYPDSDLEKLAKIQIRIINEYYLKGKEPSMQEVQKIFEEGGLKEMKINIPALPSSPSAPLTPPPPQ